jgi:hypothetical protein
MAVDPGVITGIQPVQQPQAAQQLGGILALKGALRDEQQAKQAQEQQRALSDIFSKADFSDPEQRSDILQKVGKVAPQMVPGLAKEFSAIDLQKAQRAKDIQLTAESRAKQEKDNLTGAMDVFESAVGFGGGFSQEYQRRVAQGELPKQVADDLTKRANAWLQPIKESMPGNPLVQKMDGLFTDPKSWDDRINAMRGFGVKAKQAMDRPPETIPDPQDPSHRIPNPDFLKLKAAEAAATREPASEKIAVAHASRETPEEAAAKADAVAKVKEEQKMKVSLSGGRESVFNQRVMNAGNEAVAALRNVVRLPLTSPGIAGYGRHRTGILDAPKEALSAALTPQDQQLYVVMTGGLQRSLAAIEASGLANVGALSKQMEASIIAQQPDTQMTKISKLAEARQIIDKGMETLATNPRLSKEQLGLVNKIREDVAKAIPWTQDDVIDLINSENPKASIGDVMKGKMGPAKAEAYGDAEKEKRYQEWKKAHGG